MTPAEIRTARIHLGLSEADFGHTLRLESPNKRARELENGSRTASPQIIALIQALLKIKAMEG